MTITDLQHQIAASMKEKNQVKTETLRFLLAAVRNMAISKYGAGGQEKITDPDILDVVKKQVKSHQESIEVFAKAGRKELEDKEKAQLAILETMLPPQMSDEELKGIVSSVLSSGEKNFGLLMKQIMVKAKGNCDGSRASRMLSDMLAK